MTQNYTPVIEKDGRIVHIIDNIIQPVLQHCFSSTL